MMVYIKAGIGGGDGGEGCHPLLLDNAYKKN